MTLLQFKFTGGIADNNELSFYEAGRFQYAAARFIYTLEKFRQTEVISEKLTTKVDVDFRIRAAAPGSFIQDVVMYAAPIINECAIKVPFEALFSYVCELITGNDKNQKTTDDLINLLKQQEENKVPLEIEKTKQLTLMREIAQGENLSHKSTQENLSEALSLLNKLVDKNQELHTKQLQLSPQEIRTIRDQTVAKINRQNVIRQYSVALAEITPEKEKRLITQLRRAIPDMALPLRSSADNLSISEGTDETSFINLDRSSAESITEETIDEELTVLAVKVKVYDIETGYGKFRNDVFKRPINFRIPAAKKAELRPKISDALNKDEVIFRGYIVRNFEDEMVSFILDDILEEDETELF